jgi:SAM-dependent methyltransferase
MVMSDDQYFVANRLNWDQRTPGHVESYGALEFADAPGEISGIVQFDAAALEPHLPGGSVRGLRLIHLQCHIGTDTISWARLGAQVTGVDLSSTSIATARELAQRAKVDIEYVESNVYDAVAATGAQFDVVYTSIGVLAWLPRLDSWAQTIAALLEPGGTFYIREGHPMLDVVDYREDDLIVIDRPYFNSGEPTRYEDAVSYTGSAIPDSQENYQWTHSMSEIIQALLDAGLELLAFDEQRVLPWKAFHFLVEVPGGWALPERTERMPLTFSVVARKPA